MVPFLIFAEVIVSSLSFLLRIVPSLILLLAIVPSLIFLLAIVPSLIFLFVTAPLKISPVFTVCAKARLEKLGWVKIIGDLPVISGQLIKPHSFSRSLQD